MGSAASVPPSDAPALSREQYIEEHHRRLSTWKPG